MQLVSKVMSSIQASWQGVFDIILCDKTFLMSISRPIDNTNPMIQLQYCLKWQLTHINLIKSINIQ